MTQIETSHNQLKPQSQIFDILSSISTVQSSRKCCCCGAMNYLHNLNVVSIPKVKLGTNIFHNSRFTILIRILWKKSINRLVQANYPIDSPVSISFIQSFIQLSIRYLINIIKCYSASLSSYQSHATTKKHLKHPTLHYHFYRIKSTTKRTT